MFVATVIVSILAAVVFLASGTGKFLKQDQVLQSLTGLGVPESWFPFLGSALYAGAVGLVVGLFWAPIGIAAAIGLVLYFLGAVIFHAKEGDWAGIAPPIGLMVLSAAALVLRIVSA